MAPIAPTLYPRLYRELMGLKYEVIIRTFPHSNFAGNCVYQLCYRKYNLVFRMNYFPKQDQGF